MKKIVLDVETLAVETFPAESEPRDKRGTVHGHLTPRCPTPTSIDCTTSIECTFRCTLGYDTCQQASCVDTCGYPYKPLC